jgi:hypothetical protein
MTGQVAAGDGASSDMVTVSPVPSGWVVPSGCAVLMAGPLVVVLLVVVLLLLVLLVVVLLLLVLSPGGLVLLPLGPVLLVRGGRWVRMPPGRPGRSPSR